MFCDIWLWEITNSPTASNRLSNLLALILIAVKSEDTAFFSVDSLDFIVMDSFCFLIDFFTKQG